MPWRESCAMEQRGYFMLVAATGEVSFAALCRQLGSAATPAPGACAASGRKVVPGWSSGGAARRTNPRVVASEINEACHAQRRQHRT